MKELYVCVCVWARACVSILISLRLQHEGIQVMHKGSFYWEYEWIRSIQLVEAAPPRAAKDNILDLKNRLLNWTTLFNFNNFSSQSDT